MEKNFSERKFYIYKFLSDCLPIYALYTVLFREKGLSITEVALLLSFWSLITLLLELPSGILADRWNRRYMISIATALKSVCYLLWWSADTFILFALGFLFWGVASAFISGTEEGLIYDNLKYEHREEEFGTIYGKGRFYATLGILTAMIGSGILANLISIGTIALISAVLSMITLLFVRPLSERNYYSERLEEEDISFFSTFIEAGKLCLKNTNVFIRLVLLIFIVSMTSYLDEYDALIIDDFHLGYIWISIIFTVRFLFIGIGSRLTPMVEKHLKSPKSGYLIAIWASFALLIFSFIWNQYAIPFLGLGAMLMTIVEVLQINRIQKEIKEEGRTTVMSIYSILQNVFMILFSLIYAALSRYYELRIVYLYISWYCVIGAFLIYGAAMVIRKKKQKRSGWR